MFFYAPNGNERPIRLCEATRQFAYDSMHFRYGADTLQTNAVALDDVPDFAMLSDIEKYDLMIRWIAEQAPVRICENERVSGAATLGMAISHRIPAVYRDESIFYSVSHLTVDFDSVLKYGVDDLERRAKKALETVRGTEKEPFAKSCVKCLEAFRLWHKRYLDALKDTPAYRANYENLLRVPFAPARNFHEAVQSLWFTFAFLRLCGNWPGIGRIDQMLGGYLKNDLQNGRLTLDEAREILAHFFIKGCEWITGTSTGSGDAQHYQNIVLGGTDENGNDVTNEVTYLVLDILEEFGISDFPTTVRLNKDSDEKLIRRTAEVMRFGGGILAVYNEDLIIDALIKYGYDPREARRFANDGCWEIQVPGATDFNYLPFDSLQILQEQTLRSYAEDVDFPDYESLYRQYRKDLEQGVASLCRRHIKRLLQESTPDEAPRWKPQTPCTVVSLFERGCVEKSLSYLEGGPVYQIRSPHIGGLADTADSLYAIKKAVYDEKRLTLQQLLAILRNNWEGEEPLRQFMLHRMRQLFVFYNTFTGPNADNGLPAPSVIVQTVLKPAPYHTQARFAGTYPSSTVSSTRFPSSLISDRYR